MRALTLQGRSFAIEDLPDPVPGEGQLLVAPFFNGICGSDLHLRDAMGQAEQAAGGDWSRLPKIVLGHEFSSEVVAIGSGTETSLRVGDRVVSLPFSPGAGSGITNIGLTPAHSGGMGALALVDAVRSFRVPGAVPSDLAALTEPVAVARHAVNQANRNAGPNIVLGCGPIGLAIIIALKGDGRGPIIAADFSDERRALAWALGADVLVDPREGSPFADRAGIAFRPDPPSPLLARDFAGRAAGLNIFECTGATGVLAQITEHAPRHSHVIYAGVCTHDVTHKPVQATLRELTVEYSFAYTPREFAHALAMIEADPATFGRLVTRRAALSEATDVFDSLSGTPSEMKVLIDVRRER